MEELERLRERVAGLERELAKAKADVREMAMQAIADFGQYEENFERAEASEADANRLRKALEQTRSILTDPLDAGCIPRALASIQSALTRPVATTPPSTGQSPAP